MTNKYLIYTAILVFAVFYSTLTKAQADYSGGEGGGYSSHSISISTSVMFPDSTSVAIFDVTVYPNPVKRDDVFKAKLTGIKPGNKVQIVLTDLIGSRLLIEEVDVTPEYEITLPYDKMSKGIYLITFQHNNQKITRRFNLTQ
jgi:hypothetical protein